MADGTRKPGRPKGPRNPRLRGLILDPEDEPLRERCWFHSQGYATLRWGADRSPKLIHRILTNAHRHAKVDHLNGNRLDNRKANLRVGTQTENMRNIAGPRSDNKSGFLGVIAHQGRWRAEIRTQGRAVHIGMYATPEQANHARLLKEKELWGVQPRRLTAFLEAGIEVSEGAI